MVNGKVLIYGGRGALGATCVQYFKNNNWVRKSLGEFLSLLFRWSKFHHESTHVYVTVQLGSGLLISF